MTIAFLDPYLSFIGPCFEYDTSIINELKKRNVDSLLFCADFADEQTIKQSQAIPAFHYLAKLITSVIPPKIFYTINEYRKIFKQIPKGSVLFIPNIFSGKELFVFNLALAITPRSKFKKILFLYRLIPDKQNQLFFYKLSASMMRRRIRKKYIVPIADSEIVAATCKKLFDQNVAVLPIPHVPPTNKAVHAHNANSSIIKLYLPGQARVDKGILTLLDAVENLVSAGKFDNFELTIQFSPAKMDETYQSIKDRIGALEKKARLRVLVRLDSDQYYAELLNADIVLTAYMSTTVGNVEGYHSRTSGVFSEAIAAAKPVITTKNTWMSKMLENYGAGIAVTENNGDELAKALLEIAASINVYKEKAKQSAEQWSSIHNSKTFCDRFLALCS